MYTWFNWFGATAVLGDGYGLDYTMADVVYAYYYPQPPEPATVTFTDYPPNGWLGWCTVANCEGQTPSGIVTGYAYDAQYYYFVLYATSDCFEAEADENGFPVLKQALITWVESYLVWLVPQVPEAPDSAAVEGILAGIGAAGAPLTVTLLWNADCDLDLYFHCDDGSVISYQNTNNEACGGTLDSDMTATHYNQARGDGSLGQVENISVGAPVEDHVYAGKVRYYSGSVNGEFQVIFSGTDGDGVLHVYGQEHVAEFSGEGTDHPYSFTYDNVA